MFLEHSGKFISHMVSDIKRNLNRTKKTDIPKEMLDQYRSFQDSWYKRMKAIHQE